LRSLTRSFALELHRKGRKKTLQRKGFLKTSRLTFYQGFDTVTKIARALQVSNFSPSKNHKKKKTREKERKYEGKGKDRKREGPFQDRKEHQGIVVDI